MRPPIEPAADIDGPSIYERLDGWRFFRPVLLGLTAAGAGLLVAPHLLTQSYPTEPGLIGTPSTENGTTWMSPKLVTSSRVPLPSRSTTAWRSVYSPTAS